MNDWAEIGDGSWLDDEVAAHGLRDKRLALRLRRLLDQFSSALGQPVPAACGDWAATKAAYHFFDNPLGLLKELLPPMSTESLCSAAILPADTTHHPER